MKSILYSLAFFILSISAFAQTVPNTCGTVLSDNDYNSIRTQLLNRTAQEATTLNRTVSSSVTVKLKPHIIRRTNGTGGLSITDLNTSIQQLNNAFSPVGIYFEICTINYVDNDAFFNEIRHSRNSTNTGSEYDMALPNIQADAVNVFFAPNANNGSFPVNWSSFPSDVSLYNKNWTVMSNSYTTDNGTLAHEIGHYLNLFHTHESIFGNEIVARTTSGSCTANCDSTGDLLCDTPADPGLDPLGNGFPAIAELVDANCNYIGTGTDSCNQQYIPDTHNIMSYAYECRTHFSTGQIARMLTSLSMDRPEITSGCNAGSCPIDETITSTITNGSNETYQASNSITGTNTVENGATAIYDATFEVTLTPGFDAVYGASFDAKLGGCVPSDGPEGAPNDPYFALQWGHYNSGNEIPRFGDGQLIGIEDSDADILETWEITQGSPNITVAILDSGLDIEHPDFDASRIVNGYNFFNDDTNFDDTFGHGTLTAGILGATPNNNIGIAGVDWNCKIMPLKIGSTANFNSARVAAAIQHAITNGANIASMSFGGSNEPTDEAKQAFRDAIDANLLLFAAGGNDNRDGLDYPARYPSIVGVGAMSPCNERKRSITDNGGSCDQDNRLDAGITNWGSNYGEGLDFVAPGTLLPSTDVLGATGYSSNAIYNAVENGDYISDTYGTSISSPFAAGVAALVWAANPSLKNYQVRHILQQTAVDIEASGFDNTTAHGSINALAAVQMAQTFNPTTDFLLSNLTLELVDAPATVGLDETLAFSFRVKNTGDVVAQSSLLTYEITHITGNIPPIVEENISTLNPGTSSQLFSVTIPITSESCNDGNFKISPHPYIIDFKIDANNEIAEFNEFNQFKHEFMVEEPGLPDLVALNALVTGNLDNTFEIAYDVKNIGLLKAGPLFSIGGGSATFFKYFASSDAVLDSADNLITTENGSPELCPQEFVTKQASITVPSGTAYILVQIDATISSSHPNGQVTESNEDNNVIAIDILNLNLGTYVPDDNFEQRLIDLGYDDVLDDYVVTANISDLTSLDVRNNNISDLTGIEDFTALTTLDCRDNQLTEVDITQNTALTVFYCSGNQLTGLDVSLNTALTLLWCDDNQLTNLDVSQNTLLNNLVCNTNQLGGLDVSNNTNLTSLDCSDNQLTGLDVLQNSLLTTLNCGGNQLADLDVTQNSGLTSLQCDNNQLTDLDVTQNTELIELVCNNNQLTGLHVKNENNTNVTLFIASNNSDLTCIEVDDTDYSTTNWTDIDSQSYFSSACSSANYLTITDSVVFRDISNNIELQLINTAIVKGFQFDINFPAGFTFDSADLIESARISGFTVSVSSVDANTFRIIAFSLAGATIGEGTEAILTFPTFVDEDTEAGDYTLPITNVILSGTDNQDVTTEAIEVGIITITDYSVGDSNGDMVVNILDLVQIIDYILGNNPDPFVFSAADVNADGVINILDVVSIQDIILNPPGNYLEDTILTRVISATGINYNIVTNHTVLTGLPDEIEIELVNDDVIKGFQFDITLPAGFTLDLAGITQTTRLDGFTVSSSYLSENTYRVLAFSFSGATIVPDNQAILKLPITVDSEMASGEYPIPFSNVVLSDTSNQSVQSTALNIGVITVDQTMGFAENTPKERLLTIYPNPASSKVVINNLGQIAINEVTLYDNSGKLIHTFDLQTNNNRVDINVSFLTSGIYTMVVKSSDNSTTVKQFIKK